MTEYLPLIMLLVGAYALWSSLQSRKTKHTAPADQDQISTTQTQVPKTPSVIATAWDRVWATLKKQVPDTSFLSSLSGHRTKLIALALVLLAVNEHIAIINPKIVNTLLIAAAGLGLYFLRVAIENMEKRLIAALHAHEEQGHVPQVVSKESEPTEAGNQKT